MKTYQTLLVTSAFGLLLAACGSESGNSSASRDNVQLEGVAATGYAMAQAKICVVDADGDTLFQGSTDALGARAGAKGQGIGLYVREQARDQARLLTGDGEFQAELAVQMQAFGMDSASVGEGIRQMMGAQADSLNGRMEQLRYQYQQMQVPGECLSEEVKA